MTENTEKAMRERNGKRNEVDLHDPIPQTSESCLDMKVTVSAKELAQLQRNYEQERFRAVCGWKNYEGLKAEVEKAGYDPYFPSRLKKENDALKQQLEAMHGLHKVDRLHIEELEGKVGNPAEKVRFTVTRAAYDQLEARANKAELEAAELRRRITNELSGGIRDVQSKLLNAQEALVDSRTECQRMRERGDKLNVRVHDLESELRDARDAAKKRELDWAIEHEDLLKKQLKDLNNTNGRLSELMVSVNALKQENERLRAGRDERQKERDKERAKVKDLKAQLGKKQSDFEEVLELLREASLEHVALPVYTRNRISKCLAKYADIEIPF